MVDIKKLKPIGVVMILACAVLALIVCFTADLGIPEKYESLHDTAYYSQNADTLGELLEELEDNVFPELSGVGRCYVDEGGMRVVITIQPEFFDKSKQVILRDFDESLFTFEQA